MLPPSEPPPSDRRPFREVDLADTTGPADVRLGSGRANEPATRLPPDARPARVRLRVADLQRAVGFYEGVLGLRVARAELRRVALAPREAGGEGRSRSEARELIVLVETPGLSPRPSRPATSGLYHVALLVPDRPSLGRTLRALHDLGHPPSGLSDHAVSESLYLADPDGNGLEIYADRPRADWAAEAGTLRLTVEPMDVRGVLAAAAERPETWTGLPTGTVVGHVHFTVSWLERSVAFYRDVLGFDVTGRLPGLVALSAGGYHHHVNLNDWAGEGAPRDSPRVAGLDAWELEVPDREARRALEERLDAAGAWQASVEGRLAALDPDGIPVEVGGGS